MEMGWRQEKKQQTKQKILQVSAQLFLNKGYANTSVNDIVAEADISRMTFFNYFSDREALLTALAIDWVCGYVERFDNFKGSDSFTSFADLAEQLDERLEFLQKEKEFLLILVNNTDLFSGSRKQNADLLTDQRLQEVYRRRLDIVDKAQYEGRLRDDIPAKEILWMYDMLRNNIVARWLAGEIAIEQFRGEFGNAVALFNRGLQPVSLAIV
jgi:AcrR family transcriptional regulator